MATCALNGVLVLERVKIAPCFGTSNCRTLSRREAIEIKWRKLLSTMRSHFFGRQQLSGRIQRTFNVDCSQDYNRSRQLLGAYTTTEKIVGGLTQAKEPCKRRLILLRHAKSSWADRTLKDHNRPLSSKGRLAAANIASKLKKHSWVPGLILCRRMGHNRGWEEAASELCGIAVELRTANAALLEAPGVSWKEVSNYTIRSSSTS